MPMPKTRTWQLISKRRTKISALKSLRIPSSNHPARRARIIFYTRVNINPALTVANAVRLAADLGIARGKLNKGKLNKVVFRKTGRERNMPESLNKVPEVTLAFWIIKIAATTLGETGGDTVTMTLNWGYLAGTALFLAALVLLVSLQIIAKKFHPFLYWATIIASTTFGTTMADFADRSLGVGYTGGSSILLFCLLATLGLWYWSLGSISVDTVNTPKVEMFYWAAITFSQTLGTALGDWMADSTGLGYEGGALVFGAALAIVTAAYYWTNVSRVTLFWTAFILTRPLGATVGDFLDKPRANGGLALSRPLASAVLAIFILVCLLILPQRAGSHPGQAEVVRE
jgi:uncharacterized membrane-anchored protein